MAGESGGPTLHKCCHNRLINTRLDGHQHEFSQPYRKKIKEYFVSYWLLAIAAQLNFCAEEMGTNISSFKIMGDTEQQDRLN